MNDGDHLAVVGVDAHAAFFHEVQEGAGHAAADRHGGEGADLLVGLAEPLAHFGEERHGEFGVLLDEREEGVAVDDHQLGVADGADRGGAGLAVDEGHFAEEVAALEEAEDGFAAIHAGHVHLDGARGDEVERLDGVVAFQHYGFVAVEVLHLNQVAQ